jgi:hypothetical protein
MRDKTRLRHGCGFVDIEAVKGRHQGSATCFKN